MCFVLVYKNGKIIIKPHGYTMILYHRGLVMSCTVYNITKSIELVTSITLVKLTAKLIDSVLFRSGKFVISKRVHANS